MRIFYTDGSASPNPGPGGYSVVENGKPIALGSEDGITTNIRMEGKALIHALELAGDNAVTIYTDSEFWINVVTKWALGWESKGWKKSGGPIKNLDIVQELYGRYNQSDAVLQWVKGHEGDPGNEAADNWANKAREGARL